MKKITLLFASVFVVFAVMGAEAYRIDSGGGPEIGFAIGGAYPSAPGQVGLDTAVKFNWGLNDILSVGIESGFGWVSIKEGDTMTIDGMDFKIPSSIDFYSFPVLGMVTFNFSADQYSPTSFYVSAGAGWSWTRLSGFFGDTTKTFSGLTYQALVGFAYDFGQEAGNMKLFCEVGYRGANVKKDIENVNLELDMSAPFARVGVAFPLGGSAF